MDSLQKLRQQINQIDQNLILTLEQRFKISSQISQLKQVQKLKIQDKQRELELLKTWKTQNKDLSEDFITKILKLILTESKKIQKTNLLKHKK